MARMVRMVLMGEQVQQESLDQLVLWDSLDPQGL